MSWKEMNMKDYNNKTSNELAIERTRLAEIRNDLAENRTLQASERTYAAWVRTGFTLASAGWTFGKLLEDTGSAPMPLVLGGTLILLGILCFVYGWYGFQAIHKYLRKMGVYQGKREYPFTRNLVIISLMTITLILVFVLGFSLLLF